MLRGRSLFSKSEMLHFREGCSWDYFEVKETSKGQEAAGLVGKGGLHPNYVVPRGPRKR